MFLITNSLFILFIGGNSWFFEADDVSMYAGGIHSNIFDFQLKRAKRVFSLTPPLSTYSWDLFMKNFCVDLACVWWCWWRKRCSKNKNKTIVRFKVLLCKFWAFLFVSFRVMLITTPSSAYANQHHQQQKSTMKRELYSNDVEILLLLLASFMVKYFPTQQ